MKCIVCNNRTINSKDKNSLEICPDENDIINNNFCESCLNRARESQSFILDEAGTKTYEYYDKILNKTNKCKNPWTKLELKNDLLAIALYSRKIDKSNRLIEKAIRDIQNIKQNFGDIITNLMQSKKVFPHDIAAALNTTTQKIYNWINNKSLPNTKYLIMLSNFFKASIDYLLGLTTITQNNELTASETNLLNNYRKLTPPLQKMIDETITTFTTTEEVKTIKANKIV